MNVRPVEIYVKEVIYAVKNKTFVTARSVYAIGDANDEVASHMKTSDDTASDYEIKRAINEAITELKANLGEWISGDIAATDNRIDAAIENQDKIVLAFQLPSNYDGVAFDAVGKGIHGYIVGRCLYSWYRQTYPKIAEVCLEEANISLANVNIALSMRKRPTRPNSDKRAIVGYSIVGEAIIQ